MNDEQTLGAAFGIGKALVRDAIWDQDRCNWLGPVNDTFLGSMLSGYGSLGPSIYDGTAGIALFLAQLGKITGDPIVTRTALGAINHATSRYSDCPDTVSLSFYTGQVGVGYAAITIGQLMDRPALVDTGKQIIFDVLSADLDGKCVLDVMLGVSASIPAIISLQDTLGRDVIKAPLLAWGDKILSLATEDDAGLSWNTTSEMQVNANGADWMEPSSTVKPNLLGYGHGACGIGLALLELGVAFDVPAMVSAGKRAFDYESHWFDDAQQSWPDLRYHGDKTATGRTEVAWCHGSTGIGLARLRAFALTGDPVFQAEAKTASRLTQQTLMTRLKPQTNMCLCHGVCGDVEFFINDHDTLSGDEDLVVGAVQDFIANTFVDADRPFPYGGGDRHQPPGFMLGIAGTGYALLRTMNAARPPSLLCVGVD